VRELELERNRIQPASIEVDEEEQTEVVPQLWVDRVVVEEVAEVVQDAAVKTPAPRSPLPSNRASRAGRAARRRTLS